MGAWTELVARTFGAKPRSTESVLDENSMPVVEKEAIRLRVDPKRSVTILLPKGFRKASPKDFVAPETETTAPQTGSDGEQRSR